MDLEESRGSCPRGDQLAEAPHEPQILMLQGERDAGQRRFLHIGPPMPREKLFFRISRLKAMDTHRNIPQEDPSQYLRALCNSNWIMHPMLGKKFMRPSSETPCLKILLLRTLPPDKRYSNSRGDCSRFHSRCNTANELGVKEAFPTIRIEQLSN